MIGLIIALISGALMSIQGVFNTEVTKSSSIWVANCFVQFTALLVCLIAWAFSDRSSLLGVFQVQLNICFWEALSALLLLIRSLRAWICLDPPGP